MLLLIITNLLRSFYSISSNFCKGNGKKQEYVFHCFLDKTSKKETE